MFSFLPPKDFIFQFSTGCLAKSSQSPAREEKLNHIDDPSAVEECCDRDPEEPARPGSVGMELSAR